MLSNVRVDQLLARGEEPSEPVLECVGCNVDSPPPSKRGPSESFDAGRNEGCVVGVRFPYLPIHRVDFAPRPISTIQAPNLRQPLLLVR